MISLEQIRQLETRVHTAVERIQTLKAENDALKLNLGQYEERIAELEKLVTAFKSEQEEIEAGIVSALSQLDALEDSVSEGSTETAPLSVHGSDEETATGASQDERDAAAEEQEGNDGQPGENPQPADDSQSDGRSQPDVEEDSSPDEEEPELDIF